MFLDEITNKERVPHVIYSSFHWNYPHIRVLLLVCNFIQEHPVALIVPVVVTKEPGSMHVQTPGCSGGIVPITKIILFPVINSLPVLHQHVKNMFLGEVIQNNTSIKHCTEVAIVRIYGI